MLRDRRLASIERRLVWIVGSPRTGTTWLLAMLRELTAAVTVDEPQIGTHLTLFSPDLLGVSAAGFPADNLIYNDWRSEQPDYFFSKRYEQAWAPPLRTLLLERFAAQAEADAPGSGCPILVKEPNGSQAALLLSRLLPRSRFLAVWRDGRDVVDSELDAAGKDSWLDTLGGGRDRDPLQRQAFLADRATRWAARTGIVEAALQQHGSALSRAVRYEELLNATENSLAGLLAWLGVDAALPLGEVVRRYSFTAIDETLRGKGKFARAATPGLWRESFSREERELVTSLLREPLERLGYPL